MAAQLLFIALALVIASPPLAAQYYNASSQEVSTELSQKEVEEAIVPASAKCMPELRTVKLRKSNDLSLHYSPSCTRVERCGGCCPLEEYFSCQPTQIEFVKFKVSLSKYTGGTKYTSLGNTIIRVEKHLKCKCDCIVKPSDCTPLQEYVKHECKCVCTNYDEKKKCSEADPKLKFWDQSDCSCQCLVVKDCTTGYVFNKHTCSCEPEQRQRIRGGYGSDTTRVGYKRGEQ